MKKTIALAVILALVCCCFASAEEGPHFVTIGEWLQAEGDCGDCILAVQVTQIHNPVLAVGTDETGSVNLFSGNGEDSMIINFMSDECPREGAVLVIANPRYNVFDGIVEMADWTLLRVLPLTVEGGEAGEAVIPEELVGTWQGTGTPKNNGSPIDLVVTIGADGTGEYFFDQGGYHENNPISISYEGNSFTVNTDESMLGGCEGTWSLEDGVLTLDITSTLPGGSTYSYIVHQDSCFDTQVLNENHLLLFHLAGCWHPSH